MSRWDLTTGQSVGARTPTLGTRCRVVDTNATQTMSAASPRSVTGSPIGARLPAVKECVGKTPTAKLSTIVRNVPVHLISWEMPEQDVTQNVPDMMNVQTTKLVSNSLVKIRAENLIQMFVEVVPTVK